MKSQFDSTELKKDATPPIKNKKEEQDIIFIIQNEKAASIKNLNAEKRYFLGVNASRTLTDILSLLLYHFVLP